MLHYQIPNFFVHSLQLFIFLLLKIALEVDQIIVMLDLLHVYILVLEQEIKIQKYIIVSTEFNKLLFHCA